MDFLVSLPFHLPGFNDEFPPYAPPLAARPRLVYPRPMRTRTCCLLLAILLCLPARVEAARFTGLFMAIGEGNLSRVKAMTPPRGLLDAVDDASGATPLTWAAQCGTPEIVGWLLDSGASIEGRDKLDMTPLASAAEFGNLGTAMLLLERGADAQARTYYGKTPLHGACGSKGNLELVRALLARGCDLHAMDQFGATAISWAVRKGKVDIALYLLEQGADPKGCPLTPFTPLHWAAKSGNISLVQALVQRGADVNASGPNGATPLGWAKDPQVRGFLEAHGAH
ncbi:ankyrin repeat domain-containing protein [Desulfovibrio aminophilus]|uniref:ankyrin repeat domain-containing protein n=1 Tax=Desulfovibrio aminophilus TaxID=81425 RepID=UPI003399091F